MNIILRYELRLLIYSKTFWLLMLCLLAITIYALQSGRLYYQKQSTSIAEVKLKDQKNKTAILAAFKSDTNTLEGKKAYKNTATASWAIFTNREYIYWYPAPLSVLSIGNRDVYPYYQEILPISLHMRLFKNEISNPVALLSGTIDFSYVIIFIIPLIIIALTFNIISDDAERGVADLIYISVPSLIWYYIKRYSYYALIMILILIVMFGMAILFIPSGFLWADVLILFTISIAYALFWLTLSFGINMIRKSSVFNVGVLIGAWLYLLVLLPSLLNQIAINMYPIRTEEFSATIRRVQLENTKESFQQVLNTFYKLYPAYEKQDTAFSALFNKAYLAQGQLNDLKGDSLLNAICESMLQKEAFLNQYSIANPAMMLQNIFCNKAESSLQNYVAYLKSVQYFNNELKKFYFDRAFTNNIITPEDYNVYPKFEE